MGQPSETKEIFGATAFIGGQLGKSAKGGGAAWLARASFERFQPVWQMP
ncbi:hypothetical protein [Bosea sp. Root381]|nr:hypothetical protein [Bosea sp. Root381]